MFLKIALKEKYYLIFREL